MAKKQPIAKAGKKSAPAGFTEADLKRHAAEHAAMDKLGITAKKVSKKNATSNKKRSKVR